MQTKQTKKIHDFIVKKVSDAPGSIAQLTAEKFVFTLPDGEKLNIGMSGGIALYPIHGQTASQLLRAADEALYRSKKHHRGTFVIAIPPTGHLG